MKEKSPKKDSLNDCEDLITEQEDDFVIISKTQKSKEINLKIFPSINEKLYKTSIITNKKLERNKSSDIIDRKSLRRILTKKQNQFFNQSNTIDSNNDNNLDDIEQIKDFRADCILYDKNKKTYIGKLFVDQDYMIYFSPEINNKPKLYFNSDYYIFPLLSIAQCITNTNYFGQSKYCKEITLKDGRNFIFKFSPDAFEIFDELIEKFAFPKISKNYFNFAYLYKNQNNLINKKNIKIYNFFDEFKRQEINLNTSKEFRLIKILIILYINPIL